MSTQDKLNELIVLATQVERARVAVDNAQRTLDACNGVARQAGQTWQVGKIGGTSQAWVDVDAMQGTLDALYGGLIDEGVDSHRRLAVAAIEDYALRVLLGG